MHKNKIGLVLTAGGARGAYQAGVLKRIGEIQSLKSRKSPFSIITGASAGAINGTALAAGAEEFHSATKTISNLWEYLNIDDVFKSGSVSIAKIASKWIKDLSFGGLIGGGKAQSLLDTSPLRGFLSKNLPFEKIQANIDRGNIYAIAVSATNYYSGKSYTFIQGQTGHPTWVKSRRLAYSVKLNVDHICASSAIPVVFAPVLVQSDFGDYYYGDGALRLTTPFSPAIRLGADKVFAIGIRSQAASEQTSQAILLDQEKGIKPTMKKPPLAQVFGVALNSIFLDHLDTDYDHLVRMNELMKASNVSGSQLNMKEPMKIIEPMVIKPSVDLGKVAAEFAEKLPGTLRYMLEGLGTSRADSADLMSYLLFDTSFTKTLIDIGYQDAENEKDKIENFLNS